MLKYGLINALYIFPDKMFISKENAIDSGSIIISSSGSFSGAICRLLVTPVSVATQINIFTSFWGCSYFYRGTLFINRSIRY